MITLNRKSKLPRHVALSWTSKSKALIIAFESFPDATLYAEFLHANHLCENVEIVPPLSSDYPVILKKHPTFREANEDESWTFLRCTGRNTENSRDIISILFPELRLK